MKTIRLLSIMLLVATFFSSCSNDDDAGIDGRHVAVQLGSGNIAVPKTTAGGEQWTQGDKIGIFMIANGATGISGNIRENADNIEYKAVTGNVNQTGFSPESSIIYYPVDGSRVDFITYYPYKTPLNNYTYPIDVSDQTIPAAIDVLYSNNATGYGKNSGTVDLQFNHVLSKLSFTLVAGTGSPSLAGAKVEISNVTTTATMNLSTGTVTATNSGQNVAANIANNGLTGSAIIIPQTTNTSQLIVTLADGINKFEWDFPATTVFEKAKNHQYEITVSKTGITVTTGNITDWTGATNNPTEGVGGTYYKIGDFYPDRKATTSDGGSTWTGIKPLGVVFWLNPSDARHGKAVGMSETQGRWGASPRNENANGVAGLRDNLSGKAGTRNLIIMRKDEPNFSSNYLIFDWIYRDINNGNTEGKWYLPARNELMNLYRAKTQVNEKLSAAGGTAISDDWYWSLTETRSDSAWSVNMNPYRLQFILKENTLKARSVIEF